MSSEKIYLGKWAIVGDMVVFMDDDGYVNCGYLVRSPVKTLRVYNRHGEQVRVKKENLRNGIARGTYYVY